MRGDARAAVCSWFRGTGMKGMLGVRRILTGYMNSSSARTRAHTQTQALATCSVLRTLPVSRVSHS